MGKREQKPLAPPVKASRAEAQQVANPSKKNLPPAPAATHAEEEEEDEELTTSEDVDEEEFDEEFEEEEYGDFEEGDDEEGDTDDDEADEKDDSDDGEEYEDDDEAHSQIGVNFDAREMYTRHIDAISSYIDAAIPDGENLVDRHDFGKCLKASIATTLTTVTQSEEDDASDVSVDTAEVMDDEDVYAVASFVPVFGFATKFESCAGLLTLFDRQPEHMLQNGTSPFRLLKGFGTEPPKALLFVNDHLNVVPPVLTAQVLEGMLEDLQAALKAGVFKGAAVNAVTHIVVLCRVQREKRQGHVPAKAAAVSTASGSFDLAAHFFTRWEDEVFFSTRDARLAVPVIKFPRYVEDQAEQDIPRCVAVGLTLKDFANAVVKISATASKLSTGANFKRV